MLSWAHQDGLLDMQTVLEPSSSVKGLYRLIDTLATIYSLLILFDLVGIPSERVLVAGGVWLLSEVFAIRSFQHD